MKSIKTLAGFIRGSLVGDQIMSLPIINVLNEIYDGEFILDIYLSRKCKQSAPLFLFQKGINKIILTQDEEFLNQKELYYINKNYDNFGNPAPKHEINEWYNYRTCLQETIKMLGNEYYDIYQSLPEDKKKPRLNRWFDNGEVFTKHVGIWTTAGYGDGHQRSPSKEWWIELIKEIIGKGYAVYQFGHPKDEPLIVNHFKIPRYNELTLFEQIQKSVKFEWNLTTDSGAGWILNAYGIKCISLITRWELGHIQNDLALAPENWDNKNISLFAVGGCSNIPIEKVLEVIK